MGHMVAAFIFLFFEEPPENQKEGHWENGSKEDLPLV